MAVFYSFVRGVSALAVVLCPVAALADDSGIQLGVSGHFKMYGNFVDQDGSDVRAFDILRDTDVTLSGESTLSNGLTAGVVVNADGDAGEGFEVEDSFAYLSGHWGRLSLGAEDGAAFMLQVAAPSADENIDGMEIFVNPVNFFVTSLAGTNFETQVSEFGLDYDNDLTAGADKITYLTPMIGGFQAGISYAPDVSNFSPASRALNGNNTDSVLNEFGEAVEVGARYTGDAYAGVSYTVGAGYTAVDTENTNAASTVDTYEEWNVGIDVDVSDFGVGAIYTANNGGAVSGNNSTTWVVGADYTVGAVRYGVSYLDNIHEEGTSGDIDTSRLAGGVVYEFGSGLSFRGSVGYVAADAPLAVGEDVDSFNVTVGTQILF